MANPSLHHHRRRRYYCDFLIPPLHPTFPSLVNDLITLALQITADAQNRNSSCAQKRNLAALSRRIRVLLLFLEELRDAPAPPPPLLPSALLCFSELHVVFQGIKLLSRDCAESSRMSLLMDHRRQSEFFHRLTLDMSTALEILPVALLDGVSSEMREQVELVIKQAKRAKMYVDANESRLYAEVRRAMAQIERREAPEAWRLGEIFSGLELRNAADCEGEIEKLVTEEQEEEWWLVGRQRVEKERNVPLSDLISFVRYGKCVVYGASEAVEAASRSWGVTKMGCIGAATAGEESEIAIPDDFRCPISLELMKDPVIVATGQTYERAAISRWIAHNSTCPKSGLPLAHTILVPNYALRSLIRRWCIQNNIVSYVNGVPSDPSCPQHRRSSSATLSTPTSLEATKLTVEFLLHQLPSAPPDTQRHIAGELRILAKCSSDNRKVIADAGAIPPLIALLPSSDSRTQEHAVAAILNLSIYGPNKVCILEAGALGHLIALLQSGSCEAVRENAAAALFSLSQVTEAAVEMCRKAEAMSGLLRIVKEGSVRGRRDAASAIFNMAVYELNRALLVRAGAVGVLVETMASADSAATEEEMLAVLAVLAHTREGRRAMAETEAALPMLAGVLRIGSPKSREYAAAALLYLCRDEAVGVIPKVVSLHDILPSLQSLLSDGTNRARRKAASLLSILLR